MESQFKELKDMVNSSLSERKDQENALEMVKTRGESSIPMSLDRDDAKQM